MAYGLLQRLGGGGVRPWLMDYYRGKGEEGYGHCLWIIIETRGRRGTAMAYGLLQRQGGGGVRPWLMDYYRDKLQ